MKDYTELRKELELKRDELLERQNRIKISKRKEHAKDWEEQASERENDDVVDALGESIIIELEQIENAIGRIDQNTYEQCASCGETINEQRLLALPYTSLCIDCASGTAE